MHCHPERSAAKSKDLHLLVTLRIRQKRSWMGQFDTETDAALTLLNYEALSETPGGEFVEIIGDLLLLIGTGGLWGLTGGASNLALKVRKLAGASYASNLIYAITAVRNDLATLFKNHEELRERIEALPTNPKFAEAISTLALRAMHTSVRDRLKRLARIVVNGVKEDDLEPESLDDMMRAAIELKDTDISMLGKLYQLWKPLLVRADRAKHATSSSPNFHNEIQNIWHNFGRSLNPAEQLEYRGSFARLQSHGMIQQVTFSNNEVGREPYVLLEDGAKFHERLQEIAAKS